MKMASSLITIKTKYNTKLTNTNIMTTIVKFLITLLLGVLLTSCKAEFNSSQSLKGNGKVITKNREVYKSFNKIKIVEEIF